jgi:hypothetical protein
MHRTLGVVCAVLLAASSVARASEPQAALPAAATQADLQVIAEKTCNDALEHDHFDYPSIDECVSATVAKLQANHGAQSGNPQPAAASGASHRN